MEYSSASRASIEQQDKPALSYWTDTTEGPTFASDKLRQWTKSHIEEADDILIPCAGPTRLDIEANTFRIDIDEDADADLHIDFRDLDEYLTEAWADAIVYDPPYTPYQAEHKYGVDLSNDEFYFYNPEVKRFLSRFLRPGGTFVQFGYTTTVMPEELKYHLDAVGLFNKLGEQNDYFGTVATKSGQTSSASPSHDLRSNRIIDTVEEVPPNVRRGQSKTADDSADTIQLGYQRDPTSSTSVSTLVAEQIAGYVTSSDTILHLFRDTPTINITDWDLAVYPVQYDCEELPDLSRHPISTDCIQPWNINEQFETGVFDAVILDLPSKAYQRNISTPREQRTQGSDKTHVSTALKRSLADTVSGKHGKVIQIGHTATIMNSQQYDYSRTSVQIVNGYNGSHDLVVSIDQKPHENFSLLGIPSGEVDRFLQSPEKQPVPTDRSDRTELEPSSNSHHCPYCGSRYYHHPAVYLPCFECGAVGGNLCVQDGTVMEPTGPDGRVVARDLCDQRLEYSEQYHGEKCNE